MLPHQGAGADQGFEDAWLLANPRAAETCPIDILSVYDEIRRPRACRVQRTSHEAGELYEYRDQRVEDDEALLSNTLANRFDWLWNHDMATDLAQAHVRLGWTETA